jgi:ABC-type antimicrobial peptide transport system permease subunit
MGATTRRLAAVVAAQAVWSVTLALAVAVVLAVGIGAAIGALTPNLEVDIQIGSIVRTSLSALAVGGGAALLPIRRLTRVDPATAFRRP